MVSKSSMVMSESHSLTSLGRYSGKKVARRSVNFRRCSPMAIPIAADVNVLEQEKRVCPYSALNGAGWISLSPCRDASRWHCGYRSWEKTSRSRRMLRPACFLLLPALGQHEEDRRFGLLQREAQRRVILSEIVFSYQWVFSYLNSCGTNCRVYCRQLLQICPRLLS